MRGPPQPKDLLYVSKLHCPSSRGDGPEVPRNCTNQYSPIVGATAVTPMGRVGEGQGDLVQGLCREDGEGGGQASQLGGDRPHGMVASVQDEGPGGVGTTTVPSSLEAGDGWRWQAQCG